MIIWINGAFGSGKTTLSEELKRRRPDFLLFDPEYIGIVLSKFVSVPSGDFQDLPSWREVVAGVIVSLQRHHAKVIIVPMTLVNEKYFKEIMDTLRSNGINVRHFFLEVSAEELKRRIEERVLLPDNPVADASAREFGISKIDICVAAAARQDDDTILLRSDQLSPNQLADIVMQRIEGEY